MHLSRVISLPALLVMTSLSLTACKGGDDEEPTDDSRTEGDADADADADSDTDADGDADSDAQKEDCLGVGDEDKDGLADCQDPDCTAYCVEDCANLTDDDADGDIDCLDSDCAKACVEDCGDTLDNDQDGLADCADDDCLDACVEDCSDTVDNDADGAIDCDDDECKGAEACPSLFSLEAKVNLELGRLIWGDGLSSYYGVAAAGLLYGDVLLYGATVDGTGPSFTCTGALYAFPGFYGAGYGKIDYVGGDCDGCDYRFEMTATVANGGLQWRGKCPVSELPVAQLGFFTDRYEISRYDTTTTAWSTQYSASYGYRYTGDYGFGTIYQLYMGYFTQLSPVVWEAPL
ncbi:hypothetical protein L6R46_03725 [Myxococcota bacterium]|jgi:hypothetical protein|nr:hypothetical protein [Myxococcota bacterium]